MNSRSLVVKGEGNNSLKNRYRLTFRDGQGRMHMSEVTAPSMAVALNESSNSSDLVKLERIDPETGVVLGGRYYE
jgi:hypothetical protein